MRIHNVIWFVALTSTPAIAFPTHVDNIPNGNITPEGSTRNCQHCHINSGGGEGWNELGQYFLEQGGANPGANPNNQNAGYSFPSGPLWDEDACTLDHDNDGYSNGDELGDPSCVWTVGDTPEITEGITNAGNAESFPGGDNTPPPPDGGDDPLVCGAFGGASPVAIVLGVVALMRRRRQAARR